MRFALSVEGDEGEGTWGRCELLHVTGEIPRLECCEASRTALC